MRNHYELLIAAQGSNCCQHSHSSNHRIRFHASNYGLKDEEAWPELQDQMIEAMIGFEKAFQPYIDKLK